MVIVESNCFNCAGGPVGKNRSDSDEFVGLEKKVENGYSQLVRMIHPALLDAAGVSLLEQRTTICGILRPQCCRARRHTPGLTPTVCLKTRER